MESIRKHLVLYYIRSVNVPECDARGNLTSYGRRQYGKCMQEICVIMRESYIKARIIKIRTKEPRYIEEAIRIASNGISTHLSSHSQTPEGFQMFLNENADGGAVCHQILNALFRLPDGNVVIERINC